MRVSMADKDTSMAVLLQKQQQQQQMKEQEEEQREQGNITKKKGKQGKTEQSSSASSPSSSSSSLSPVLLPSSSSSPLSTPDCIRRKLPTKVILKVPSPHNSLLPFLRPQPPPPPPPLSSSFHLQNPAQILLPPSQIGLPRPCHEPLHRLLKRPHTENEASVLIANPNHPPQGMLQQLTVRIKPPHEKESPIPAHHHGPSWQQQRGQQTSEEQISTLSSSSSPSSSSQPTTKRLRTHHESQPSPEQAQLHSLPSPHHVVVKKQPPHQGPLHGHGLLPSVPSRNSLLLPPATPAQPSRPQHDGEQHHAFRRNSRSDASENPNFLHQANNQISDPPRPQAEIRSFQLHRPAAIFSPKHPNQNALVPGKKLLRAVLDKLQKKDKFGVFTQAVDATEVPDYYDIIKDPMDFGTMRKRITSEHYTCLDSFQKDISLICDNAMKYNARGTVYYRHAHAIKEAAERILEDLRKVGSAAEMEEMIVKQKLGPSGKKSHKKRILAATELVSVGNELGGAEPSRRMSERYGSAINSGTPCGNNIEDSAGYSVRAKCSINDWRRFPTSEENPRNTYKPPSISSQGSDTLLSIACGESLHLVPTGHHFDFPYARSLARFAADLGPNVWKIAAEKIRRALPHGFPFGAGWIGEREMVSGIHLSKQNPLHLYGRPKENPNFVMELDRQNSSGKSYQIGKSRAISLENSSAIGTDSNGLICNAVNYHESRGSVCLNESGFLKPRSVATVAVEKDSLHTKHVSSSDINYRDVIKESSKTNAAANLSHENVAAIKQSMEAANITNSNENSAAIMNAVNSGSIRLGQLRNRLLEKCGLPDVLNGQSNTNAFSGSPSVNASLASDGGRNASVIQAEQQWSFADFVANGHMKSQTSDSLRMHATASQSPSNFADLQQEAFLHGHVLQHGNQRHLLQAPHLLQHQQQQMNSALYSSIQHAESSLNLLSRSVLTTSEAFDPTSMRNRSIADQSVSGSGNSLLQNLASQNTLQVPNMSSPILDLHASLNPSFDQPNCSEAPFPDLALQL